MPEKAFQDRSVVWRELAVRVASAMVLAAATLALAVNGRVPFALLVAAVASVLIWEWGRLVRRAHFDAATIAGLCGVLIAIVFVTAGLHWVGALAIAVTAAVTFGLVKSEVAVSSALGPVYVGLPSLTLVAIHGSVPSGELVIVFLLLVVWSTDTGAFVAGRAFGGPKLWVAVSPNKTWSGLIGGTIVGSLTAFAFAVWLPSPSPGRVVLLAAGLAVVSQLGDLCESALKRAYGVKDTSHLIPGHGGFMDRVDGLVFAALAAGLWCAVNAPRSPAAALLGLP